MSITLLAESIVGTSNRSTFQAKGSGQRQHTKTALTTLLLPLLSLFSQEELWNLSSGRINRRFPYSEGVFRDILAMLAEGWQAFTFAHLPVKYSV